MSSLKIATLLGIAGVFGVMLSVILGRFLWADYLLDAAFVCLVAAGVVLVSHVLNGLWTDFTRSA